MSEDSDEPSALGGDVFSWTVMPQRNVPILRLKLAFVLIVALAPVDARGDQAAISNSLTPDDWTPPAAQEPMLSDQYEQITLQTLLVETLLSSPAIAASRHAVGIEYEQIVSQDAAFDPRLVMGGGYGLTNDPVGNTLVTGGPSRLRERSWDASGGVAGNSRRGGTWDLSQELGLLDSNSQFFQPRDQGDARLNLALTQPLMAGRGSLYATRLVVQAKIDASIAWESLRQDTTRRLSEVTQSYLELHEHRCHAAAQTDLLQRTEQVQRMVLGRTDFDVARLGLAKSRARIGNQRDRLLTDLADVRRTQAQLRMLVGVNGGDNTSTGLQSADNSEWICLPPDDFPHATIDIGSAMTTSMMYRAEIKSALQDLQSAALGIRVTKNQLMPRLDAVLNGYLAGLNGRNEAFRSFGDQFTQSGPGVSALLQYELPYRNRAARSRHREAMHRYRQSTYTLQNTIIDVRGQVEAAIISIEAADQLRTSKRQTLSAAADEEYVLTRRFETFGPGGGSGSEGGGAALLLESLFEAQQRRTDAVRALVSAEIAYHSAAAQLQRAMGTVMISNDIAPTRAGCSDVYFDHSPITRGGFESIHPRDNRLDRSWSKPTAAPEHGGGSIDDGMIDADVIDAGLIESESPTDRDPELDLDLPSGREEGERGTISIPIEPTPIEPALIDLAPNDPAMTLRRGDAA